MNKEFLCIICPLSCPVQIKVQKKKIVTIRGFKCEKGKEYALKEFYFPKRTLTTTVPVKNGHIPLVSIRSDKELPKKLIFKAMKVLSKKKMNAPVKAGQIITKNILNSGVNIIATKNIFRYPLSIQS